MMDVVQVKPLTLQDIALHKSVEVDKQTVAGILGVPAFYLGVGTFDKDEHNNFVSTRILSISKDIEQTFTRGLLWDPKWYFKFNPRSLFAYSITDLSEVFGAGYVKGYITGNEVRDAMGLSPMDGLDELVILENFIPVGSIGDQKKLKGKEAKK
jgi:HK97 family phage portal protein